LRNSLGRVPALLFAGFVLIAALNVIRFVRGIRAVVSDGALGKTIHVDTPAGALDLKPRSGRDPMLASLVMYPGAQPVESLTSGYEASFSLFGHGLQCAAEKYGTPDPAQAVREFFERNLPDWNWDRHNDGSGERLCHDDGGCRLAITIRREGSQTIIEPAVARKSDSISAVGPVISSDSTYGVLR
jgi:hypothetical protein